MCFVLKRARAVSNGRRKPQEAESLDMFAFRDSASCVQYPLQTRSSRYHHPRFFLPLYHTRHVDGYTRPARRFGA